MKGQIGNKKACKLPKLIALNLHKKAYASYCKHLANGNVRDSWYFEDHKNKFYLIAETLEKYIKENPTVFPPIQHKIAWAKGYEEWESIVSGSAKGDNTKANTASLQMVMRNKYGWDKKEKDLPDSDKRDLTDVAKSMHPDEAT